MPINMFAALKGQALRAAGEDLTPREPPPNEHWCRGCNPTNCPGCRPDPKDHGRPWYCNPPNRNGVAFSYRYHPQHFVARSKPLMAVEHINFDITIGRRTVDLQPRPPWGRTRLYDSLEELHDRHADAVRQADLVIVGSFVPQGAQVGDWVQHEAEGTTAFYDIDTPVTLARLARGEHDYLRPDQIAGYGLYLSFTGGPTLRRLEREFGSPRARVLYCSVDPQLYFPEALPIAWDLGYMGTYSDDRQPGVDRLLLQPARAWPAGRFIVAGPQYPESIRWPANVEHRAHLPPAAHRAFYNRQRCTLNITRADMVRAGWSPSVRLFEAAACGTPIVSDRWDGIETLLLPGREIVLADGPAEVLALLRGMDEDERRALGERARRRILAEHTAAHRARQLVAYALEAATEGTR